MLKIPKNDNVLVENQMETHFEYDDAKPTCHIESGEPKRSFGSRVRS